VTVNPRNRHDVTIFDGLTCTPAQLAEPATFAVTLGSIDLLFRLGRLAIHAGTKASTPTTQNDHAGLEVPLKRGEEIANFHQHHRRNGIETMGPIQPDVHDRALLIDLETFEFHDERIEA
jgi:hypothetical protein